MPFMVTWIREPRAVISSVFQRPPALICAIGFATSTIEPVR
jgi:hypothetical protein